MKLLEELMSDTQDFACGENYIADLYERLASQKNLRSLYLPHSDVYYVRNAVHKATGVWLSCPEMQKIMEEEWGWDK